MMIIMSEECIIKLLLKYYFIIVKYAVGGGAGGGSGGSELGGESHSADITGLKPSSTFHIRVIATNSAGSAQTELTINTPSALISSTSKGKFSFLFSRKWQFFPIEK